MIKLGHDAGGTNETCKAKHERLTAMQTIFINRRQYDLLVSKCASWMQLRWAEYSRSWSIGGGVSVTGRNHEIENLRCQLEWAAAN